MVLYSWRRASSVMSPMMPPWTCRMAISLVVVLGVENVKVAWWHASGKMHQGGTESKKNDKAV